MSIDNLIENNNVSDIESIANLTKEELDILQSIPVIKNINLFTYDTDAYYITSQEEYDIVVKYWSEFKSLEYELNSSLIHSSARSFVKFKVLSKSSDFNTKKEAIFTIPDYYIFIQDSLTNSTVLKPDKTYTENTITYILVPLSAFCNDLQLLIDKLFINLPQDYLETLPKNIKSYTDTIYDLKNASTNEEESEGIPLDYRMDKIFSDMQKMFKKEYKRLTGNELE